jgi:hypothetical protein
MTYYRGTWLIPSKTGASVPAFDLVLGLAFAWVPDANNGYAVRSRCAKAVSDLSFLTVLE